MQMLQVLVKCDQHFLVIMYSNISNINLVNMATEHFKHELTEGTDRVLRCGGLLC